MGEVDWDSEEITTFDDFIAEMSESTERLENRLFDRMLLKIFPSGGLAGYRTSYAVLHPWVILERMWLEIKLAWQRVFQGYDMTVVWSIDYHLAKFIPIWLMELKVIKNGIPGSCFGEDFLMGNGDMTDEQEERAEEKWNSILDEIAEGFIAYNKMEENFEFDEEKGYKECYAEMRVKLKRSFDLMYEYFGNFWD